MYLTAETPDHYVYAIVKKKKALISMLRHSYRSVARSIDKS